MWKNMNTIEIQNVETPKKEEYKLPRMYELVVKYQCFKEYSKTVRERLTEKTIKSVLEKYSSAERRKYFNPKNRLPSYSIPRFIDTLYDTVQQIKDDISKTKEFEFWVVEKVEKRHLKS